MTVTPRLAFVTVGGTLVFLGLAVLGWGGFASFVSHPARIALAVVTFLLAGAALFTRGNLSPGEREDRGNRWVLIAFGLIGLLSAYLPAYTDRNEIWMLDGDSVRWLGVFLFAAGGALRIWPDLCSAGDSADWSPFSQGISWSRAVCTVLSAIPATWGCWSVRWGGPLLFDRGSACCSWRSCFPRSSRGCVRRSPSCERSSAASTKAIVPVRHG